MIIAAKLKKDPGIPNLWPYKEAMMQQIEEAKAREEEERQYVLLPLTSRLLTFCFSPRRSVYCLACSCVASLWAEVGFRLARVS